MSLGKAASDVPLDMELVALFVTFGNMEEGKEVASTNDVVLICNALGCERVGGSFALLLPPSETGYIVVFNGSS